MKSTPFKRAIMMMQAISAAISAGMSQMSAAAMVGEYRSRGKGLGRHSGKKRGNTCTNWLKILNGQTNGRRECERRMRQIQRGIIRVSA